jgi:hypothetical protein
MQSPLKLYSRTMGGTIWGHLVELFRKKFTKK